MIRSNPIEGRVQVTEFAEAITIAKEPAIRADIKATTIEGSKA